MIYLPKRAPHTKLFKDRKKGFDSFSSHTQLIYYAFFKKETSRMAQTQPVLCDLSLLVWKLVVQGIGKHVFACWSQACRSVHCSPAHCLCWLSQSFYCHASQTYAQATRKLPRPNSNWDPPQGKGRENHLSWVHQMTNVFIIWKWQ